MRKLLLTIVALSSVIVLSSCALWPFGSGGGVYDDDNQQVRTRLDQIEAAVDAGDAAALKELFSTPALEQAPNIDDALNYFLSFFPNGAGKWELIGIGTTGENKYGAKTELLRVNLTVTVDGTDYWVFFADFTANDTIDPDNVGLFALGVTPWTEDYETGPAGQFSQWTSAIHWDELGEGGYPGIYVPE